MPPRAGTRFSCCRPARNLLAWIRIWSDSAVHRQTRPSPVQELATERSSTMESIHDDRYVVFLRCDRAHSKRPDCSERPLTTCSSYEEARRIQRELHLTSRDCVIRYIGPAGGGD